LTTIANLVERSATLKAELLEYSWHPRFHRDRNEVLRDRLPDRLVDDESELVSALDYFLLQHELRSGMTVVERFVASRRDLPEHERELLLGWRDVVEGIFEVKGRDGDALIAENLVDELTYRVYSNMGPSVFRPLATGDFLIGRLVPIGPDWLVSGHFVGYRKRERPAILRAAYEVTMQCPASAFRNPDKLANAQRLQKIEHDRFVDFFGDDFVVVPGAQLTQRMRAFYKFCGEQTLAELSDAGKEPLGRPFHTPTYPADLVASDAVAIIHDEVDGLDLCAEFGLVQEAFADPGLLRHPEYRRRVRDYLDDDTISPVLFARLAARDTGKADEVFRKLLGRKHFDWTIDGEKLMRRRKPQYFEQPRLPSMIPIGERLRPYAVSA
jgi:hypothetical protein